MNVGQHYSNPERASEPNALPDVETFYVYPWRGGQPGGLPKIPDGLATGWYWQIVGTHFKTDGSCHPDCGPIVMDAWDVRGETPLLDAKGQHAHEGSKDGCCWHESWCEPNGPFATEQEAIEDAQSGSEDDSDDSDEQDETDGDV